VSRARFWGPAIAAAVAAGATTSVPARAGQGDPCASMPAKPGFMRRGELTGTWGGDRTWLEDHGVTVAGSYDGEVFATPEADTCCVVAGLAALGFDVDLGTAAARGLGTVHVLGFAIHGEGLSDQIMDIYGVSNVAAPPDVRLFEAWYDQPIGGRAGVRAGLLAADQEFIIAPHATVLMNGTFGVIGQMSLNVLGPVYPIAAPGVSAHVDAGPVTVRAAIYDGELQNRHGMPTALGPDALVFAEVGLWKTVSVGGWVHTARANGAYVVVDRALGRRLGGFARFGLSPSGQDQVYADAGLRFVPAPWRPKDFTGLGVAYSHLAADPATGAGASDSAVAEATYQIALAGWVTVQPDVQVVFQPARTFAVGAVRATVVF
jgi:porin